VPCARPPRWCKHRGATFKQSGKNLYCTDTRGNKWEIKKSNDCKNIQTIFNTRIEDTHQDGLPTSRTLNGIGFAVHPSRNVFHKNNYYEIKGPVGSSIVYVQRIDKKTHFRKDVISYIFIKGVHPKSFTNALVKRITPEQANE
jgi:hypothetical protein